VPVDAVHDLDDRVDAPFVLFMVVVVVVPTLARTANFAHSDDAKRMQEGPTQARASPTGGGLNLP
jgi:hypothetical protein